MIFPRLENSDIEGEFVNVIGFFSFLGLLISAVFVLTITNFKRGQYFHFFVQTFMGTSNLKKKKKKENHNIFTV